MNLEEKIKITNKVKIGGLFSMIIFSIIYLININNPDYLIFQVTFFMIGLSATLMLYGFQANGNYKIDLEYAK